MKEANSGKFGVVLTELSELYQTVKEQQIDLVLVDENRSDLTHGVAIRIRRINGLTDIWQVVSDEVVIAEAADHFDGQVSVSLGGEGLAKKTTRILADKKLLARYDIVGRSAAMKGVAHTIERIAPTEVSVLIVGSSGSGKELVAHALHNESTRKNKPFVAINCGALSEGVLESELFGHEKGAFTGSVSKREGLFHKAEGGTVFLDEIGETRPDMQVKLLRVLEDGTYYPVGSSVPRRADVRVVAATNRDLTGAIADRQFREDLYFRISVVKITVPPLMERRGDIQPLLQHFWTGEDGNDYTDSALEMLTRYDWPGNVRQLRNLAARMSALKPGQLIDEDDITGFLAEQHQAATHLPVSTGRTVEEAGQELIYRAILSLGNEVRLLRDLITSNLPGETPAREFTERPTDVEQSATMEEMEMKLIERMLIETKGNRKETAKRLGIGERTLYRKLNKYGLH
jgi:DNA-binding NtrC family response regulator